MLGRETVETLISRKNKEDETSHKSNRDDFWVFSPANAGGDSFKNKQKKVKRPT